MKYRLQDLIDIDHFQVLQDRLNEIYSFPSAIIDNDGNILTATAWQDICTKFHRVNEDSCKHCIESDKYILEHLNEANPAVSYRCPHGLVDNATPIIIDGEHYGNFFTGQFFLEKPDLKFFESQAEKYGYDKKAYLQAVEKVPIWSQEQLNSYLFFIRGLITVISENGLKKLKEIEAFNQIKEGEERFRRIFEEGPLGMVIADKNYQFINVNESFCAMIGYSEAELSSMTFKDITHPDYLSENIRSIERLYKGEIPVYRTEKRYIRKDGQTIWGAITSCVVRDANGSLLYFLSMVEDITERKNSENELLKFKLAFERSGEAIFLTNVDGSILYVNPTFEKIYGFTREEALGKTPRIIKSGILEKQTYEKLWAKLLSKQTVSGEIINKTKDGRIITVEGSINPVVDANKNLIAFLAIQRDITDRKISEKALRDSEEKYRRIAENMFDVVVVINLDGTILYVSPGVVSAYGYTPDELAGENIKSLVPDSEIPILASSIRETAAGRNVLGLNLRLNKKNGTVAEIEVNSTPLYEDGKIVAGQAIVRDITETKHLRDLESRAQRLDTAGKIAGQVAHDFNNLLGPMIAYPEFLKEALANDPASIQMLADMEKAAANMAEINQQLLTLSRRGHIEQNVLCLNDIILDCQRQLSGIPKEIRVSLHLDEQLMNIKGSSSQLVRIIMNLITNGIDAMQGQGQLSIRTENYYAEEIVGKCGRIPEGEYVKITITDNGSGIHDDILPRIFDAFFTTKSPDKNRGSGLGLSVVAAVMADHNGYIDLESKTGFGTSFFLYFPITREEIERANSSGVIGGTEKILIVDDDAIQRDVAMNILKSLGYKTCAVESGEKATEFLRNNSVDLIILDMIMPAGIDGVETYNRVLEINPDQKAIIISGFSESERVRKAKQAGVAAFVRKPLTRVTLATAIRRALDKYTTNIIA